MGGVIAALDMGTLFVPANKNYAQDIRRGNGKRRYRAGPHPTPTSEPQREDYPSRQAWRADHRRWKGQG